MICRRRAVAMRCAGLALMVVLGGLLVCEAARAQAPSAEEAPAPMAAHPPADSSPTPSDDLRLDLQKPEGETPSTDESWWQKVVRASPNCKFFTDGCRMCSLTACSNIGIACQPKEWSCSDADTASPNPETTPNDRPETKP